MSKKRGLSLEEKRKCVLEIFHDTKDVFQLKDIEKIAPKKGVIQQSVKEVVQSLVDDDLVHQEKIGSSNFFWSFPSEAAVKLSSNVEKLESQVKENQALRSSLEAQVQQSQEGKQDSAARTELLEEKAALEGKVAQQQGKLAQYADNDPDRHKHIQEGVRLAKEAANRWLDNVEMMKKWMKKRFEGQDQQLDTFFTDNGYKEDMEYL